MSALSLSLPYPPSVNSIWRNVGPRTLLSAKGRAYRAAVALLMRSQGGGSQFAKEAALNVVLHVYPPDRRKRDLDNLPKAIFDALTHAGLWADDSQVDEFTVKRMPPVKGGCVLMTVEVMA